MKTTKIYYNDLNILVPGLLIKRAFHRPIFVSISPDCSWDFRSIATADKYKLLPYDLNGVDLNGLILPQSDWLKDYNEPKALKRLGRAGLRFAKASKKHGGKDLHFRTKKE